jgi:streptogramin lyase
VPQDAKQAASFYRYKVGSIEITVVDMGTGEAADAASQGLNGQLLANMVAAGMDDGERSRAPTQRITEVFTNARRDAQRQCHRQYHARSSGQHVWLAAIASNQIIKLDPATKEFTIYDVPVGVKNNKNATPYGMAVGGDSNIWVVENAFDQIARVDRTTGKIDEFPLGVKDPVAVAAPSLGCAGMRWRAA